jgi:CHAT domain-containing protein
MGFLYAGAASAIASLWSVVDISTMMLMARFYWVWCEEKTLPAHALRLAQMWLRDTTNAEKIGFLEGRLAKSAKAGGRTDDRKMLAAMKALDPGERTFSDPFYWAPFVHVGI